MKPIIYRDRRLEDGDDTLHTEPAPAPRNLDSRQLGDDAFNLETLPTLSDHPANERDNNHGISNGESTVTFYIVWKLVLRNRVLSLLDTLTLL
jgi:hypothetical protein